jgi:GTPase
MLIENQHPHNKSIMICLLGIPNVGKSSLINHFLGFDLSAVTEKPQTTRNQYQCAFTIDRTEVVMVDTPGLHKPSQEMNRRMNGQVKEALDGVDLNLVLMDLTKSIESQVKLMKQQLGDKKLGDSLIVFTKSDLVDKKSEELENALNMIREELVEAEKYFAISSKTGDGVNMLTAEILDRAQPGPHLYPGESVSNKSERFFVTEYIREQAFCHLKEEVPYEIAVTIDEFNDFRYQKEYEEEDGGVQKDQSKVPPCAVISATILVNKPSQRAIVVGRKGSMIKEIGTAAREKIEAMVGGKIRLNLHVKVSPAWFKNNFVLEEIGLPRMQNAPRVWRKK